MLKYTVESLDGLSDETKALYEKKGDKEYMLKIEGATSNTKLNEFRDNNIRLLKEVDDIKKKYKDIDPVKFVEMTTKIQELEDKKLLDSGKIDELVQAKLDRIKAEFDSKETIIRKSLESVETEKGKLSSQLEELKIDSELQKAVNKIGQLRPGAMQDALQRGRQIWELEEGKPVPKNTDGSIKYNDKTEAWTFTDWAEDLVKTAPFLFKTSKGGGAGGGDGDDTTKTITKGDQTAFEANIEDIAKGKIKVV